MSAGYSSGNCSERTTCSSFSDVNASFISKLSHSPCCTYVNDDNANANMNSSFDSSCNDEDEPDDTLNIVNVVVNVIETILTRTHSLHEDNTCNAFYIETLPQISLHDYLIRIITYTHIEQSSLICALIYMDRLSKEGVVINWHTVHKVLFTSIFLSMKFNEDCIYNNSVFAEIAGVTVMELLSMESEFVNKINFNFYVNEIVFNTYSSLIVK